MKNKTVKGFPNYTIFEDGTIYSHRRLDKYKRPHGGIFLKKKKDTQGYLQYALAKNGKVSYKRIHCLVAEHFIGRRPPKMEINHIDNNKENNHFSNLEYVSPRENIDHRERLKKKRWGVKRVTLKSGNPKWECHIRTNGKQLLLGYSLTDPEPLYELYRQKYKELHGKFPW